jgi:hypothetical protein
MMDAGFADEWRDWIVDRTQVDHTQDVVPHAAHRSVLRASGRRLVRAEGHDESARVAAMNFDVPSRREFSHHGGGASMRRLAVRPILRNLAIDAALLASAVAPALADDFTLTGTYQGFVVCDDVTGGEGGAFGRAMTMDVVQTGDAIAMRNTVAVDPAGPASHTLYRGRVAQDAAGAVSGYAEACGGTFPHKELVRIAPASPSRAPFNFAADTIFVSDAVPGVGGKLVAETCKWALTRVSTETPEVEVCP